MQSNFFQCDSGFTFMMPRFHYCAWIWFDCIVFIQFSRLVILEWDSGNHPRNSMIRKFVTVPYVRKKALFLVWQWIWWTRVWIWACKLVDASELIQFAMCKWWKTLMIITRGDLKLNCPKYKFCLSFLVFIVNGCDWKITCFNWKLFTEYVARCWIETEGVARSSLSEDVVSCVSVMWYVVHCHWIRKPGSIHFEWPNFGLHLCVLA